MRTSLTTPTPFAVAPQPVHPKGSRARVLLTSVFGPYAQDDEFGSRKLNPMELYHNQVTREQGVFSLRMFHRSWGIMMIQANIEAPCTLLDFPTLSGFIEEIRENEYDVVGITSIIPNVAKVETMCELIRQHQPHAKIVIGGHVSNIPNLRERIDADHIVLGEGIAWMRRYLGEDPVKPLIHPRIESGFGARSMGIKLPDKRGDTAAALIPSVGCPVGCNFCSTSAMFGGKGKSVHFFEEGDELFDVMCGLEEDMGVDSFFTMDENFLLHRKRALRLLEQMEKHNKSWSLYVFSSVKVLQSYTIEQLVGLGISWVWMGIEGKGANYAKLGRTDTLELIRTLQSHGIRVLGSTIIGFEEHAPGNIDEVIDYAVMHDTEFHQFMLYTPIPGTPLHREMEAKGIMLDPDEYVDCDIHGQLKFNYHHPNIKNGEEGELVQRAFLRDFEVNGPSVTRIARTVLQGWRRYKDHPNPRIRARFRREGRELATTFAGALWAARHWYRKNKPMAAKMTEILKSIHREFGLKSRLAAPLVGRFIRLKLGQEHRRLRRGHAYEPRTFRELNDAATALNGSLSRNGKKVKQAVH
ncbi:MAG: B12-binding domain-containing radical SAM protein [Planctomycetota bacterium]|jgi:radical SAM superfamily enzyme YgiQ (UPF0313 family)